MKRILIVLGLLTATTTLLEAQNKVFFVRLGASQLTGFIGGEIQVGHVGLEGGWAALDYPDFTEPWNMGAIALSGYTGKPFDNSFYGSVGYSWNGVIKITMEESRITETEYDDSIAFLVGYKWGGAGWFSLKGGIGYQLSGLGNSFTGEFTIGIALLAF